MVTVVWLCVRTRQELLAPVLDCAWGTAPACPWPQTKRCASATTLFWTGLMRSVLFFAGFSSHNSQKK